MVNAQQWLDENYPKAKRSQVQEIFITQPLEGELDLKDFTCLTHYIGGSKKGVEVYISPRVDNTKLTFNNLSEHAEIIENSWFEIHKDFKYYQNHWTNHNFTYEQTKQWADVLENFNPKYDWVFCTWLRDTKHLTPEQVKGNLNSLKLEWWQQTIHPNFTQELKQEWIKFFWNGTIAYQKAQDWIKVGFNPAEAQFAKWLENNYIPNEEKRESWQKEHKLFQSTEKAQLKQEYLNDQWAVLHPDFAEKSPFWSDETYQHHWEENNLTYQDAQDWLSVGFIPGNYREVKSWKQIGDIQQFQGWIAIGFKLWDYDKVKQWKNKGFNPSIAKPWVEIGIKGLEWINHDFTLQETKSWLDTLIKNDSDHQAIGFSIKDYEFAVYLRYKGYQPSKDLDLEKLKQEFQTWKANPPAQEYLDVVYPQRQAITELNLNNEKLTGSLDLSDFVNLKELDCSENYLTNLNLNNCLQLKTINCSDNNLQQDLSFVSQLVDLEWLDLSDNPLTGSLDEFLVNLKQLKELKIYNTNFNAVNIDQLPRSLEEIKYFSDSPITSQLAPIRYGWCKQCNQPNNSYKICPDCFEKDWEQDLAQSSGQELAEKFIQQQKDNYKDLKWIPHEQFTNIQHLADGGFSKIYKATWKGGRWGKKDETVVLKTLTDSKDITLEFLQEITNTKLVDEDGGYIVWCYGISQDENKNYIMVMQYINEGNLRQYLKKGSRLSLLNKLDKLGNIASGLDVMHNQNLVHRDLHSGNILDYQITDLGLSRPANSKPKDGEIFGVLPYVAPEVILTDGKEYTQASDIYSFGIITYELLAQAYPYYEQYKAGWNDIKLSTGICQGLRPNLTKLPIPQELKDFIKKCWDANPQQRPTAEELCKAINGWHNEIEYKHSTDPHRQKYKKDTEFYQQYLESGYDQWSQNTPYQIHPQTITHSKLINTKQIIQLLRDPIQSQQALEQETTLFNYFQISHTYHI